MNILMPADVYALQLNIKRLISIKVIKISLIKNNTSCQLCL